MEEAICSIKDMLGVTSSSTKGGDDNTVTAIVCPICGNTNTVMTTYGEETPEGLVFLPLVCAQGHKWTIGISSLLNDVTSIYAYVLKPNYSEYIKSIEWRSRADDAKERAGYRCQLCNVHQREAALHAHHRTYERLGCELPGDITVLCKDCHAKLHDKEER